MYNVQYISYKDEVTFRLITLMDSSEQDMQDRSLLLHLVETKLLSTLVGVGLSSRNIVVTQDL